MASIVKRGKSFSVVYTYHAEGKRKQRWETYHSYEAAVRRKEQIELIRTVGKQRAQNQDKCLSEFLEEYVALYGRVHWSCSTYTTRQALMQKHILPLCGSMRLTEFSPKVVAALYCELQKLPNITPHILAAIQKLLHSAFEQAVLWEYVHRNPFHKAEILKPFSNKLPLLSKEEMKKLLQNSGFSTLGIAVHLAFAGSLRKGEILALTWDDIDFSNHTVSINKSLKRVRNDAMQALMGKDILYQFPPVWEDGKTSLVLKRPKTHSSVRTVYLPVHIIGLLQDWKAAQPPCRRGFPDLIFRHTSGRPLQEETLPRMLEKQLLALGLPRVTFHSLRHSSITYKLILTGGNIKAVQGDSGHAQAEMITEQYGHIIDSCRKECAEKFQTDFYASL